MRGLLSTGPMGFEGPYFVCPAPTCNIGLSQLGSTVFALGEDEKHPASGSSAWLQYKSQRDDQHSKFGMLKQSKARETFTIILTSFY